MGDKARKTERGEVTKGNIERDIVHVKKIKLQQRIRIITGGSPGLVVK